MARVSVIIPVYNDTARLRLCLDALAKQTLPHHDFEVIVVDNGSDEPPMEVVAEYSFASLAEESQPGSYAARNRGLEVAQGKLLAFTDSDCIPSPGWLEAGVAAMEQPGFDGQLGGAIEIFPENPDQPNAVELYDMVFGLDQQTNVEELHFAATANMFTTRAVMDAVGVFDATVKSGGDTQFGQKVHRSGLPVTFLPEAVVRHPARDSIGGILRQARRHGGGHADKAKNSSRKTPFRAVRSVVRMISPPVAKLRRAIGSLSRKKVPAGSIVKVCGLVLLVKYSRVYAFFRSAAGFSSERQ